jgi:uncharacterized protein YaiI (UPF0178 family)
MSKKKTSKKTKPEAKPTKEDAERFLNIFKKAIQGGEANRES